MKYKDAAQHYRNLVFIGEAGSGKSEIAVNFAVELRRETSERTEFFDLDMTKPLFRSRDAARIMEDAGVTVHYEKQFMDAPTAGGGVIRALRDDGCITILDIGGDHTGAKLIGGYASLLNRDDTSVFYVVNPYRPWSASIRHIDGVLSRILGASHIAFSKLRFIMNPNLGADTADEDIETGAKEAERLLGEYPGIEFMTAREGTVSERDYLPLRLYLTYPWEVEDGKNRDHCGPLQGMRLLHQVLPQKGSGNGEEGQQKRL